jgi:histidine triad (HIT) family protein
MAEESIFSKIIAGKIPATFVYRDERMVAIRDINPQAPTHILIIPVRPIRALAEADAEDSELIGALLRRAHALAEQEGIASSGYRLVLNAGADGGQSVDHLHVHLLGGRAMRWPPG